VSNNEDEIKEKSSPKDNNKGKNSKAIYAVIIIINIIVYFINH